SPGSNWGGPAGAIKRRNAGSPDARPPGHRRRTPTPVPSARDATSASIISCAAPRWSTVVGSPQSTETGWRGSLRRGPVLLLGLRRLPHRPQHVSGPHRRRLLPSRVPGGEGLVHEVPKHLADLHAPPFGLGHDHLGLVRAEPPRQHDLRRRRLLLHRCARPIPAVQRPQRLRALSHRDPLSALLLMNSASSGSSQRAPTTR